MAKPTRVSVRSEPRGPSSAPYTLHGLRMCVRALKSSEVRSKGRYPHARPPMGVRVAHLPPLDQSSPRLDQSGGGINESRCQTPTGRRE
eukprot:6690533-Prymnesium_polylepis.1